MTRGLTRRVGRLLVGTLLLMQLGAAACACPGLSPAGVQAPHASAAATSLAATMERMAAAADAVPAAEAADCAQMGAAADPAAPQLCARHCRAGQQSERAPTLVAPVALLTSLYLVAPRSQAVQLPPAVDSGTDVLAAVSPPLFILHCCLRD